MSDEVEGAIGPDRRAFIKRLVIGTAFAVPVVSSFTMVGVQSVTGGERASAQITNPNTGESTGATAPAAVQSGPRFTG